MLNHYLQKAYDIALNITKPEAERSDAEGVWVEQTINALKEAKMTGLVIPEKKGGLGFGLTGLVKVSEILGRESLITSQKRYMIYFPHIKKSLKSF